jgi:hypothetical protein
MLYISGKSSFNFSAASDIHHSYLVQDRNNALRKMWTDDSIAITSSMKNNYPKAGVDKWLDRLSQIQEMLLRLKQSSNINPITYFPQCPPAPMVLLIPA